MRAMTHSVMLNEVKHPPTGFLAGVRNDSATLPCLLAQTSLSFLKANLVA